MPGHTHVRHERDRDHPDEGHADLDHREQVDQVPHRGHAQAPERRHERIRHQVRGLVPVNAVQRALQTAQRQNRQTDDQDDGLDEVCLAEVGTGEAGLTAHQPRVRHLTDPDEGEDAERGQHSHELGDDLVRRPLTDDGKHPVGLEELPESVHQGQNEGEEAHRHEPATPRMPQRLRRVWPKNSLSSVQLRCPGRSVRVPVGTFCPSRTNR